MLKSIYIFSYILFFEINKNKYKFVNFQLIYILNTYKIYYN